MSALITPTTVSTMLEGDDRVVVLDVQYELGGRSNDELYRDRHIPGARALDLDTALAGPPGAGGRHPLPEAEVLERALRQAGVEQGDTVVVYDQRTSLSAARAWWVLRWAGLDSVLVLDGGLDGWERAGYPTSTEQVDPPPGGVSVQPGSQAVLDAVTAAQVAEAGVLVDARTPARFRGEEEPIDAVAGHIPGAVNVPMADLIADDGTMLPAEQLRARFHAVGAHRGGSAPVGTYCGSGITAAHSVLAMHEAGIAALPYIGSWSQWITDSGRPIATVAAEDES